MQAVGGTPVPRAIDLLPGIRIPGGTTTAGGVGTASGTAPVLGTADGVRTPMERTPSAGSSTCILDLTGTPVGQAHEVQLASGVDASIQAPLTGTDHPLIIPTREHLDNVRRLMKGDEYIGRGCRQRERELPRGRFCNPFKVSEFGRELAVNLFEQYLDSSQELTRELKSLSGKRLLCHCSKDQRCHADALILKFSNMYPEAYSRTNPARPPTSSELNLLAKHREEPQSEEGSSADEGVPPKGSGWCSTGEPMSVGIGYTSREYCDGQGLASPGRWPVASRRYPDMAQWQSVASSYARFTERHGTTDLLMTLALGRVKECPFKPADVKALKDEVIMNLASMGMDLERSSGDRDDVPIDFRFLGFLLRAAEDPEVGIGNFAKGVRVGPGVRMPRLPALYKRKKKWRLASQADPRNYLEDEEAGGELTWRRNYSSLDELSDKVIDVLEDQSKRGQILKLSEAEAKRQ